MHEIIVFIGGFLAAFLGTMAGGGAGFIALYPLIFLGLPLNAAIATNNCGGLGFFPPAIRNFAKKGLVKKRIFVPLLIIEAIGALVGTFLLISLNELEIKIIVTIVIVPAFFLLVFQNKQSVRTQPNPLWKAAYLFSSIYFNLVGAGAGFVRMFALMRLRKLEPLQAAANGFTAAFPFVFISVGVLWRAGLVDIRLGAVLLAGNLIGAHLGSKIAIKKGNSFVRYMLLCLMVVTVVIIWIR